MSNVEVNLRKMEYLSAIGQLLGGLWFKEKMNPMIERGVFGIGNPLLDILAKVAPGMCNAFEIVWVIQYESYSMTGFNKISDLEWPQIKGVFYKRSIIGKWNSFKR